MHVPQNVASHGKSSVDHIEVVSEAEEIQGDNLFDVTSEDDTGQSHGARIVEGDHDGSSVDPFPEQT